MDRNNVAILTLAGAGLLGAIALGVVLKGSSSPDVGEPTPVEDAKGKPAEQPKVAVNAEAGPRTIPELAKVDSYTTTESGLMFADLVVGSGDSPVDGSVVVVEYTGYLEDGNLFDSSYNRTDPFRFPLGKGAVIKGWDEGVATMKPGGKRQLKIPGDLAYGPSGRPPRIPPNATLIFDVELKEVLPPRKPPEAPQKLDDSAYTTTASGLKYHDFAKGDGLAAVKGMMVEVDYSGWLTDGTRFDSSLERAAPIAFPLGMGRVIQGWDEGIEGMQVGGRRQLVIPHGIAYGERGRPPVIPPAATLVFEVELVGIKNAPSIAKPPQ